MADPTFPLVEYDTDGEFDFLAVAQPMTARPEHCWKWHSKVTIDLRHVTSAHRYGECVVDVTFVGSGGGERIRANYDDFVRDWNRAKQGEQSGGR